MKQKKNYRQSGMKRHLSGSAWQGAICSWRQVLSSSSGRGLPRTLTCSKDLPVLLRHGFEAEQGSSPGCPDPIFILQPAPLKIDYLLIISLRFLGSCCQLICYNSGCTSRVLHWEQCSLGYRVMELV